MPELNEDFTKRLPPEEPLEAPPEPATKRVPPRRRPPLPPAPPAPPPPPPEDDDLVVAAAPPEVDPVKWEDFAVFRETFLAYFTHPYHNEALRGVGDLLFEMTLASWGEWPDQPEGWLRGQLRAVIADMRHLQGFLETLAETPAADPYESALHRTAVLASREIASAAEHIEEKLGTWRGEME